MHYTSVGKERRYQNANVMLLTCWVTTPYTPHMFVKRLEVGDMRKKPILQKFSLGISSSSSNMSLGECKFFFSD